MKDCHPNRIFALLAALLACVLALPAFGFIPRSESSLHVLRVLRGEKQDTLPQRAQRPQREDQDSFCPRITRIHTNFADSANYSVGNPAAGSLSLPEGCGRSILLRRPDFPRTLSLSMDFADSAQVHCPWFIVHGPPPDQHIGFVDFDLVNDTRTLYYYLTDQVGSVIAVMDEDGEVVNRYDYDAFGNLHEATSFEGVENRYRFHGREWDEHAQHYYYRFRTYLPELGAFIGPDMKLDISSMHGQGNYVAFGNNPLVFVDPMGLASENVPTELLKRVQSIADELVETMPTWVREATSQRRGRWLHGQLEMRLGDLDNVLIIAESSIDKAGRIVSRGTRGNPIPDIIFLKSGVNREALLSGAESLVGHVDAVADLKTGFKGVTTRWGQSVGQRLGLGLEDIHKFTPGGSLVDDFARAPAVRGLASRLVKRGAVRTAGKAIIIAGVLFAYQHAKAEGMDDSQAAAYAAASVYGGDLVYDGTKWLSDLSWDAANGFARGSSAGQYIQAIESAIYGQNSMGPNVDASGRKLETILRTRTPTAGDSLLLID